MKYIKYLSIALFMVVLSMPSAAKPIALVFKAQKDDEKALVDYRGYFRQNINTLKEAGFEVRNSLIIDSKETLAQEIAHLPSASVGFIYIIAHGSPKSISFSETFSLTASEIETWTDLHRILAPNAWIFLHSCLTGKLIPDFFNNIQFAFTKLTIDMPDVTIIAPSECLHSSRLRKNELGSFDVYMKKGMNHQENIALSVAKETKELFSQFTTSAGLVLSQEQEDVLKKSIKKTKGTFEESVILANADYQTNDALSAAIMKNRGKKGSPLSEVKYLVEELFASIDGEASIAPETITAASPVFTAIAFRDYEVLKYLIQRGADFKVITPYGTALDYAKKELLDLKEKGPRKKDQEEIELLEKIIKLLEAAA